jgi:hypothetical protein
VFILHGVKVLCFDTLLKVLILKVFAAMHFGTILRVRTEGWGGRASRGDCCEQAKTPASWVTVTRLALVVNRNILLLSYPFERIRK